MDESKTLIDHRTRIARVVAHLEAHLDEPLDAPSLARVGALSEFHFHRVFRAIVGESAMGHVRRLRLERAARELRHGDAKVIDVASRAGFDAPEAFTRAFSSHFGVAPSDYRKAHAPAAEASSPPHDYARVVTRDAISVFAMRHVGAYAEVGVTWAKLHQTCAALGIGPGEAIGLCWDDPEVTAPARFRYDACLALAASASLPSPPRTMQTIEAGRFAVTTHRGGYSQLADTYGRLTRWALERDLGLLPEPSVERYLVGPPADESSYVTEISLRLA